MNRFRFKCKGVLLLLFFLGCAHQAQYADTATQQINRSVIGKKFWLKQSLYAGQFYDDERFQLLHHRPFTELRYVQMPDGATLLPPKHNEIIPMGSSVTVLDIEWPSSQTFLNRPIFSPRYLPWIKMEIAMDRGDVSIKRPHTFISIIPLQEKDISNFDSWFHSLFSKEDTNPWLLSQPSAAQKAILHKRVEVGMSLEAVIAAIGEPDIIESETEFDRGLPVDKLIASYPNQLVVVKDKTVAYIQPLPAVAADNPKQSNGL